MAEQILTVRDLNRSTLSRQMLLERADLAVPDAVERLVGLQAQQAPPPHIGLWTRLPHFERDELAARLADRTVVKATMMRGTLHVVTTADYRRFRATLQPVLSAAFESVRKGRGEDLDVDELVAAARRSFEEQPRTFAEITAVLTALRPDGDPGAMRYAVRTHLPLVQVPVATGWSFPGNPKFALAESWLGRPLPDRTDLPGLFCRYLEAFGPATVGDFQTWSGLSGVASVVGDMKDDLQVYRDEQGRELLDLPGSPLPGADSPAPPRFLPDFDNLLLAHQRRTRVIADEHRSRVFVPMLRVRATVLVDGFVAGVWKAEKAKGAATLVVDPFARVPPGPRRQLEEDGERLIRFVHPDARSHAVRFGD